jgi:hypothetical protein
MADPSVIEEHQLPVDTPVYFLDCVKAWKGLSDNVRSPNLSRLKKIPLSTLLES